MSDKILAAFSAALKNCSSVEKAILFGSRARGDNRERSDYDVAIGGKVSSEDKRKIFCAAEDLPTLLKIDLVYLEELSDGKFKENIYNDGVIFYERKTAK